MEQPKYITWVLRIAVAGEFIGHDMFAIQGKAQWAGWISKLTNIPINVYQKIYG